MPPITVMIKPASGMCNMRCSYCFYIDETTHRETENYGKMKIEVLQKVIKNVLSFAHGTCTIAFQGGEPTLAGLDFFREVVRLQSIYNVNKCQIFNAIQTNGYALNSDWAAFFANNNFLVGVSLDGPKEIHDKYRFDAKGEGTYSRVMKSIQLLKQHKVEFNILSVITKTTCKHTKKIQGFFERNNFEWQQYIPCLDPLEEKRGGHPWSLTPDAFGEYLKTSFTIWYSEALKGKRYYHRYFDNLLLILNRQHPEACGMGGICNYQYVVEADGSVFPCDFYMLDEWKIGNLATDSIDEINDKREELQFIEQSKVVNPACEMCKWYTLCRGGCRRDRDYFVDGIGLNYYCEAYKDFFEFATPKLVEIYRLISTGQLAEVGEKK